MTIDPFHPLAVAAREVNEHAASRGIEQTLAWLEIGTPEDVFYLAEQRALRAVAAHDFGLGDVSEPLARKIVADERWPERKGLLAISYADGLTTGWHAHALSLRPYSSLRR